MKTLIVLFSMLVVSAAQAQSGDMSGDVRAAKKAETQDAFERFFAVERPNEIKRGRLTYSGVFVQIVRAKNPLQLVNPAAPIQVGTSEFNTARDAMTRRSSGLKLFAISFSPRR